MESHAQICLVNATIRRVCLAKEQLAFKNAAVMVVFISIRCLANAVTIIHLHLALVIAQLNEIIF